jgi:HD-GYP domain-containing protein (c-di-GMP phosphodiesterase class II)
MGETIPLAARIAAVADVLDALTRPRSYRGAQSFDAAAAYLSSQFGSTFDPALAQAFRAAARDLEGIVAEQPEAVTSAR